MVALVHVKLQLQMGYDRKNGVERRTFSGFEAGDGCLAQIGARAELFLGKPRCLAGLP